MARLRGAAPFGALRWERVEVDTDRVELHLVSNTATARFWIGGARPSGGYRVEGDADEAMVDGLRRVMDALRPGARAEPAR